jgi:hypothetical protein
VGLGVHGVTTRAVPTFWTVSSVKSGRFVRSGLLHDEHTLRG